MALAVFDRDHFGLGIAFTRDFRLEKYCLLLILGRREYIIYAER
ncbi:MAG: hypothetical protein AAFQ66_08260 [Pseudomonadota bacterium]